MRAIRTVLREPLETVKVEIMLDLQLSTTCKQLPFKYFNQQIWLQNLLNNHLYLQLEVQYKHSFLLWMMVRVSSWTKLSRTLKPSLWWITLLLNQLTSLKAIWISWISKHLVWIQQSHLTHRTIQWLKTMLVILIDQVVIIVVLLI